MLILLLKLLDVLYFTNNLVAIWYESFIVIGKQPYNYQCPVPVSKYYMKQWCLMVNMMNIKI